MSLLRIWRRSSLLDAEKTPMTHMWDLGDEQWELTCSSGQIRHWRIVSREIVKKDPVEVHETCEILPECPVPKEALLQIDASGWQIEELVVQPMQVVQPQLPSSHSKAKERVSTPLAQPSEPSSNPAVREQRQLSDPESQGGVAMLPSCILPTELWSSLSQWIPPSALFQPSLHRLADVELSGEPHRPSDDLKGSVPYSHTGLTQRPRAKQDLRTKHANPRHHVQHVRVDRAVPLFV